MSRAGLTAEGQRRPSLRLGKKLAWRRVRKVLGLQWRSVLLSILVIVETVYFGTVYVAASKAVQADKMPTKSVQVEQWGACLVLSGGKKDECLGYARVLGLSEQLVIASLFMSAVSTGFALEWVSPTDSCTDYRAFHLRAYGPMVNAGRLVRVASPPSSLMEAECLQLGCPEPETHGIRQVSCAPGPRRATRLGHVAIRNDGHDA